MIDILGTTSGELATAARRLLPPGSSGIAAELYRQALRTGRFQPAALVDAARAEAWRLRFRVGIPALVARRREPRPRGTVTEKAVLRTGDGLEIECVRVPIGARRESLCVSTQLGCGLACRFCETGRMGLLRDLSAAEIVGQVVAARTTLGWSPSSVVFMGMGEPLANFDALAQSLRVLTDPNGLGYGWDRLTVCTAGDAEGIRRLGELGRTRLNLAVSLNAADDALRDRLMPINRRTPLAELQAALAAYRPRRNFQLGIHYCLMPGVNDRRADATAVARFCAPLGRVMVHLIPYNPGTRPLCRAPTDDEIVRFVGLLRAEGLPVRRRITKGRSVMAACGQLGNTALRQARAARQTRAARQARQPRRMPALPESATAANDPAGRISSATRP